MRYCHESAEYGKGTGGTATASHARGSYAMRCAGRCAGRLQKKAMLLLFLFALLFSSGCAERGTSDLGDEAPKTTAASELGEYGLSGAKNEEVSFGTAEFTVHGTLSIPDKDKKKYPAVVLVGGSGPTDRDETVGANKIFKDISQNLVKAGIAVLRYDKRTLTHLNTYSEKPEHYTAMTIYHEIVDDAVFAVQFLRQDTRIDQTKIYVIGHSLGGNTAPEIARLAAPEEGGESYVAGIVLMAANLTPIWEALVNQSEYIAKLDGNISDLERQQIALYRDARNYISSSAFNEQSDYRKSLQIYPPYWLSLKRYDALKTAQELNKNVRIMVAQGGRDYQVTTAEYEKWKKGLGERAECYFYEDLNHLFIEGTGRSTPQEYLVPGSVSKDFIDDLVGFVLGW